MNIILLGPPGSGKGTQAHLIANKYNIPNISAGSILRTTLNDIPQSHQNNLYNSKQVMYSGNLVSDDIVIQLVIDRLTQNDCKKGFILDGFPRTKTQALSMKKNNITIDFIIEFIIPDSTIINRVSGRRIHLNSGRTYHILFNPPKHHNLDDITGEDLVIRLDDQETAVRNRLNQYYQHTQPLLDYYKKESKKNTINYYAIDGTHNINNIYKQLIDVLNI